MLNWFKREPRYPAKCITNLPVAHFPNTLDTSKRVSQPTKEEENIQLICNILTQLEEVVWAVPNTLNFVVTKILTGLTERDICLLLAQTKDPEIVQLIINCRPKNL